MAELKIQVKADITGIEKLIDQLKELQTYKMYDGADQTLVDLDDVVKIFADHVEAEVAQPQWRCEWILCSESLPEEGENVLITDEDGYVVLADYARYSWEDDPIVWYSDGCHVKPVAWMPLPKPYKGERQ